MKLGPLNILSDKTLTDQVESMVESQTATLDYRMLKRIADDISGEWEPITPGHKKNNRSDLPTETREKVVAEAIKLWLRDPMVGNAVDLFTFYVLGNGMPKPRAHFNKAQEVIDAFWNDPENKLVLTTPDAQQMKVNELQLQGNLWLTVFTDDKKVDSRVLISDIPDDEIKEVIPHSENRKRHLFYKRVHEKQKFDFQTGQWVDNASTPSIVDYHADWKNWNPETDDSLDNEERPEVIADGRIFHLSINRLSDGKFGNPRVTRIIKWAHAFTEFQTARVRIMQAAAWLAWRQKSMGDASKVNRLANSTYASTPGGDGTPVPGMPQYAAMIHENQNTQMEFVRTDTGAANAKSDGQMLKGTIATGVGLPSHYFGDTDTNLATATSLELPVQKMCEAFQEMLVGAFKEIIDFTIENAIRLGKLPKPKTGKFSDIKVDSVFTETDTTIKECGFSEKWLLENHIDGNTKVTETNGDKLYAYELSLPNIIQRQLTETINSVVNVLTSFDPEGTNSEMTRWAFEECLRTLGDKNPSETVERVFPAGKPATRPQGTTALRNKAVKSTGDPYKTTQERTGAPTQARNADEVAAAQEAAERSPELAEMVAMFTAENDEILALFEDKLLAKIGE